MLRIDDKLTREQTKDYVDRANASMDKAIAAGAEPNGWLRSMFEASDMAYGVWPDLSARNQFGVAVLHGSGVLAQARDTNRTIGVRTAYLRCKSKAEAQAMCETFGDDKRTAA